MSATNQPIFRVSAMRHYMQNQEKSSYLRFIPLPITLFLWGLLGVLLVACAMAWNEEIPTYVNASGLIVSTASAKTLPGQPESAPRAVLFLPPAQAATLHSGMPVRLLVGGVTRPFESRIAGIAAGTRSPADIHARYEHANCSLLLTQPVTEVTVMLPRSAGVLNGSLLTAQITVGSQRLLALLPGVGTFFTQ